MTRRDLYLFGSLVTGEFDQHSDVDILVISDDPQEREKIPPSWSLYQSDKIAELYERGTLFAWHLYYESIFISSLDGSSYLTALGEPKPYATATFEIEKLIQIAKESIEELNKGTVSFVFELGLIHVSLRNIAMAASKYINNTFIFSKYAPFLLAGTDFPLSMDDYEKLLECRRSSTRGTSVQIDRVFIDNFLLKEDDILSWCNSIYLKVQNGQIY